MSRWHLHDSPEMSHIVAQLGKTHLQVLALGQLELEQVQVQVLAWVLALGLTEA